MNKSLYFDYAATTPLDPQVFEKMREALFFDGIFASAASPHAYGKQAKELVEKARYQVASLISADANDILWTSGATESNNLAIKGVAELYQQKGRHIVTCKTEHASVLGPCQYLEKKGFSVTYLSPEKNGLIDIDKLQAVLREDTILVSLMHVNNEIGVIQDLNAIANLTSQRGILLHVDAVQSVGKILCDVQETPIDLLSVCAHKLYGPKGIGALYVRRKPRVRVAPQILGGGQEQGMRSGTLATHQIIGMGEAFALAARRLQTDNDKYRELQQRFLDGIAKIPQSFMSGDNIHKVPSIINIGFEGIPAKRLMDALPGLAISSGSACGSKGVEPSHVLRALGQSREQAESGVRFSFGRPTVMSDIDAAISQLKQVVETLR